MYLLLTFVTRRVPSSTSNTSYKILRFSTVGFFKDQGCRPSILLALDPVCVRATWMKHLEKTSIEDEKDLASFCIASTSEVSVFLLLYTFQFWLQRISLGRGHFQLLSFLFLKRNVLRALKWSQQLDKPVCETDLGQDDWRRINWLYGRCL